MMSSTNSTSRGSAASARSAGRWNTGLSSLRSTAALATPRSRYHARSFALRPAMNSSPQRVMSAMAASHSAAVKTPGTVTWPVAAQAARCCSLSRIASSPRCGTV